MAPPLDVRDPPAHELARECERERSTTPLARRLAALADRACSKAGANPRPVTEADRDALWERSVFIDTSDRPAAGTPCPDPSGRRGSHPGTKARGR